MSAERKLRRRKETFEIKEPLRLLEDVEMWPAETCKALHKGDVVQYVKDAPVDGMIVVRRGAVEDLWVRRSLVEKVKP